MRCGAAPGAAWRPGRRAAATGPAPWRFAAILIDPPRDALRAAIAARWAAMLAAGAVEEVRALVAQGLDPALPAMRAHGVPELAAMLAGRMTPEEASRRAHPQHRAVHQAAGDLVPPPCAGRSVAHAYDPCAYRGCGAIIGKNIGGSRIFC